MKCSFYNNINLHLILILISFSVGFNEITFALWDMYIPHCGSLFSHFGTSLFSVLRQKHHTHSAYSHQAAQPTDWLTCIIYMKQMPFHQSSNMTKWCVRISCLYSSGPYSQMTNLASEDTLTENASMAFVWFSLWSSATKKNYNIGFLDSFFLIRSDIYRQGILGISTEIPILTANINY